MPVFDKYRSLNSDTLIEHLAEKHDLDWSGYNLSHFHLEKLRNNCRRYVKAMSIPKWNYPTMEEKLRNMMKESMVVALEEFYTLHTNPDTEQFRKM